MDVMHSIGIADIQQIEISANMGAKVTLFSETQSFYKKYTLLSQKKSEFIDKDL